MILLDIGKIYMVNVKAAMNIAASKHLPLSVSLLHHSFIFSQLWNIYINIYKKIWYMHTKYTWKVSFVDLVTTIHITYRYIGPIHHNLENCPLSGFIYPSELLWPAIGCSASSSIMEGENFQNYRGKDQCIYM